MSNGNTTLKQATVDDVYDAELVTITGGVGARGKFFRITYPDIDHPLVAQAVLNARKSIQAAYQAAVEPDDVD
jgi:hypothetical protein